MVQSYHSELQSPEPTSVLPESQLRSEEYQRIQRALRSATIGTATKEATELGSDGMSRFWGLGCNDPIASPYWMCEL